MKRELAEGMVVQDFGTDNFYIFSDKGKSKMCIEVDMNGVRLYMPRLGEVKKSHFPELYKVLNDTGVVVDEKLKNKIENKLL